MLNLYFSSTENRESDTLDCVCRPGFREIEDKGCQPLKYSLLAEKTRDLDNDDIWMAKVDYSERFLFLVGFSTIEVYDLRNLTRVKLYATYNTPEGTPIQGFDIDTQNTSRIHYSTGRMIKHLHFDIMRRQINEIGGYQIQTLKGCGMILHDIKPIPEIIIQVCSNGFLIIDLRDCVRENVWYYKELVE